MKITKFGHCCMLLEIDGIMIVTDPGNFTTAQNGLEGIDAVLITHEHADHFHIESVKAILAKNPNATVITNAAVGALLEKEGVASTRVGDGEHTDFKGVSIEGFGKDHAVVYEEVGNVENTAFLVSNKFYFPGDNFHVCGKDVEVLALPVAGPWMKYSEAIDFAKAVNAKQAFGVHDGMITPAFRPFIGALMGKFVPNTQYFTLADGETREF
jgi:L-ascorbate metabolism protein UlaG (beta-lactamase superfamily)